MAAESRVVWPAIEPLSGQRASSDEDGKRLDACGYPATRTPDTIWQYRDTARQLIRRSSPEPWAEDAERLAHTIHWFKEQHEQWAPATIRFYRQALEYAVESIEAAFDIEPWRTAQWRETLARGPRPKPASAKKRTSARKRKSFSPEQQRALFDHFFCKKTATGQLLAWLIVMGPALGLRPCEWHRARIAGSRLVVICAKATNRRALGANRAIRLTGLNDAARSFLEGLLKDLRAITRRIGWAQLYQRLSKALRRGCEALGIKPISLYTLRHQALATAKRGLSAQEVAALAGHASPVTAGRSYAKRRGGWAVSPRAVPCPTSVERVRSPSGKLTFRPKGASDKNGPPFQGRAEPGLASSFGPGQPDRAGRGLRWAAELKQGEQVLAPQPDRGESLKTDLDRAAARSAPDLCTAADIGGEARGDIGKSRGREISLPWPSGRG